MAKALIIKSADFSENALDHVSFGEVPCTGITLDESSLTMDTIGGTETLGYTLSPENTTDNPSVSSSNTNVVSISGNTLTAVGVGTATVTVTCGEITATCTVKVELEWLWGKNSLMSIFYPNNTLKDFTYGNSDYSNFVCGGAKYGEKYASLFALGTECDYIYPYPIQIGTESITVTAPEKMGILVQWYKKDVESSDGPGAGGSPKNPAVAKLVTGETPAGGSPWSVATLSYLTRTIEVPEGADSFVIALDADTVAIANAFDKNNPGVTVTFN